MVIVTVAVIREMFAEMVVRKNPELVARYYHPDFVLTTNGSTQDYEAFERGHRGVYGTDVTYAVEYDDQAWVEAPDRVAGRVWITVGSAERAGQPIEVLFIATLRNGLIHRPWELTSPDWSQLGEFVDYPR